MARGMDGPWIDSGSRPFTLVTRAKEDDVLRRTNVMKRLGVAASVALLVTTAAAPGVSARAGGTDRPIHGAMSGDLTFDIDFTREVCPVVTVTEAAGTMSHLGRVTSRWEHCPPVLPGQTAYTNGHVLFVAANGDELVGEYEDPDGEVPFVIDITGGTGRFEDASGVIMLLDFVADGEFGDDDLPIQPWYWEGVLEGAISY
jgi:hypothetical protein